MGVDKSIIWVKKELRGMDGRRKGSRTVLLLWLLDHLGKVGPVFSRVFCHPSLTSFLDAILL
jgi:hypothetical protein